jgi:hypothetical protein
MGGVMGAAVAAANALKAMGTIVCVEPQDFLAILERTQGLLVVYSPAGVFSKHKYLTSYKGLVFFTKTSTTLAIPASVELVAAKKILLPQM